MKQNSDIILYTTEDGLVEMRLRARDGTVWLTQAEIAMLFDTTQQNISLHLQNIFNDAELSPNSVYKESLYTAADGKAYRTKYYNLDAILAIGYRVRSPRGIQFRAWATTTLSEYLRKGFVMDDERLKNPGEFNYFDELLSRIRDIRASEKLFYQKVKDVYATSVDYNKASQEAQTFFKKVQNKMLFAVTGMTAAELVIDRSNAELPNMGLTSWDGSTKGKSIKKTDVITAKNYLNEDELAELNRIVTMFLDVAEDTAQQQKVMYMKDWEIRLDEFLSFNRRNILNNPGTVSHDHAEQIVYDRFKEFENKRKNLERVDAELEANKDLIDLIKLDKKLVTNRKSKKKE